MINLDKLSLPTVQQFICSLEKFSDKVVHLEQFAQQIHEEDRIDFKRSFREYFVSKTDELNIIFRFQINNTLSYKWMNLRGVLQQFTQDSDTHLVLVGYLIDVNEEKMSEIRLLKEKQQLDSILNNLPSRIVYLDNDFATRWTNINDWQYNEVYSEIKEFLDGKHDTSSNADISFGDNNDTNKRYNRQFVNSKTGRVFDTWIMHASGDIGGKIVRIDDVTDQIKMIKQLKEAKHKAEESEKLKAIFLANMSHEIRTPLNSIKGFSELLIEEEDSSYKEQYISYINNNITILLNLIDDILEISKIESGIVIKYERCNFSEFFNDLANSLRYRLTNPDVEFIIENPYDIIIAEVDRPRISQVVTNFVTNAIKHTHSGTIRVGYSYKDGIMEVYTKDTGVGIPNDKKHLVFKRFQKLDEISQGTGLGLAIVQELMVQFGCECGFESEVGKGSYFWARGPLDMTIVDKDLAGDDTLTKKKTYNPNIDISKLRILIAEDNDGNSSLLSNLLHKADYVVVTNGIDAVEYAKIDSYDIILMDLRMPLENGLEATKHIREFNQTVPIIAITASANSDKRKESMDAGCSDFLAKPIDKEKLFMLIDKYCGSNC